MKRNGFTLIELLGVFIILALILVISIPSITGMLKKQKENVYKSFLDDLYLAAEAYVQNSDEYDLSTTEQPLYIQIGDIINAGFFRSTTVDPSTNETVNRQHFIKITVNADHTYQYEYVTTQPE